MPSRSFYWPTVDGFLEKNEQKEVNILLPWIRLTSCLGKGFSNEKSKGITATPFQPSTTQPRENGFTINMDDCDSFLEGRDTSEVPDSFPAQPIDIISENMLFDDARLEQNDILSIPVLHDLHSGPFMSTMMDPQQDPAQRSYRGHSLSLSDIRELQAIAMPHCALSIANRAEEEESCCSLEAETEARGKKRKSSMGSEETETVGVIQTRKHHEHNAIEKRYRANLNDKLYALRQSVPSLRTIPEDAQVVNNIEEGEGSDHKAGHKLGKAEILTGAAAYISHLEAIVERLSSEVVVLKARVMAFERQAILGSIVMSNDPSSKALLTSTLRTVQAGKLRLQEFSL